ncbi:DUF3658 domain-containing protein [Pedobacter sp. GR22-6]|uniref:DUF3658 domain-containing protein n=1 Tax=Pedobacter sp. GR22-6 TaxID=3127957 RepID=UPI00307F4E12
MKTNKEIHVVFGENSYLTLHKSGLLDPDDTEVIALSNALNEGPVCSLESTEQELQARTDWFIRITKAMFAGSYYDQHRSQIEDLGRLSRILEYVRLGSRIYLWTGLNAAEFTGTARLFYYIASYADNFSIATFPHFSTTKVNGKINCTNSLATTRQEEVPYIFKNFKLQSETDFQVWKKRGQVLMTQSGNLRILQDDGSLKEVPENYFDSALRDNCKIDFQESALTVAYTLFQIDFAVGDIFLTWRLIEMAKNKEIEYKGDLKALRDFELRLPVLP